MSMASCTFTISNYCPQPIWPATLAGAGTPQLSTTGFRLDPGQSVQVPAPTGWSGRVWARTGCDFDGAGVVGASASACQTGDCGGRIECAGTGSTPPATLFEVTLAKGAGDRDYYDVSLVDGYNLPVVVVPQARQGGGGCAYTGCTADLNRSCPKELQVDGGSAGAAVACRSACEAFGQDQYCCSGAYATPTTCRPTAYSAIFKSACPRAYSYAYDDGSSIFTCNAVDYTIAFCLSSTTGLNKSGVTPLSTPAANGQNVAGGDADSTPLPPIPADNNGAGISSFQPPPPINGAGSANQPPPTDNNGVGDTDPPPWMMPSSASKLYNHLWFLLLLPALLLFRF
ncbi:hypothetical protein GUJ93_ZPchr0008g13597 [Zizania palustris]|uniref:Thaumatin-like protein n=1 Tax=Zizania palustris TaxID=103762 RepID=A0A8J5R082_ZIZPA|nr:hypothetical protein GUJ93_ZPchr0008g13597 [Zizania palustris]